MLRRRNYWQGLKYFSSIIQEEADNVKGEEKKYLRKKEKAADMTK